MITVKETVKQVALDNFSMESVELVTFMFLMNEGTCKLEGNEPDYNVIKVLADNSIPFDIREMMNGQRYIELTVKEVSVDAV